MNRTAESYGQALFALKLPEEAVRGCEQLLEENPKLMEALISPAITAREKHRVIDRVFSPEVSSFVKILCDNGRMAEIQHVWEVYERLRLDSAGILPAVLIYANRLEPEQEELLKQTIMKKYNKAGVKLTAKQDPSLVGGFILRVGDEEYDHSAKGRLKRLYRTLAWR